MPQSAPTTPTKCAATKRDGTPCRAYAMHDSQFCAAHAGLTGAPVGNQNRTTHGFYSRRQQPLETIDDVITDALNKQGRLSDLLDEADLDDTQALVKLFALHGQNASRLGRLLRDQRALSGQAADGLLDAIGKALDEISTEIGVSL